MTETPRDPHDPSSDPSSTGQSGFTDEDRPDTAPTEVVRAGQAEPSAADTQTYPTEPTYPAGPAYLAQPTASPEPPTYGQPDPGFPAGEDAGFDAGGADSGSGDGTGAGEPPQPERPSGRRKGLSPVALVLIGALVGGGVGGGVAVAATSAFTRPESSSSSTSGSSQTIKVNNESSVTAVTAAAVKASPSVVTITTVAGGSSSSSSSSSSASGTGSGVIWTSDGYIVTNNHVVTLDGETSDPDLTVTLSNGKQYPAKVVGLDASADLAVIKISATGLTPISRGDSSKINVGDAAVALGAPLGLSNSVTDGIVSALNRGISVASSAAGGSDGSQSGDSPFGFWGFGDQSEQGQSSQQSTISLSVIQTDASINPGNSGGALVNTAGKLIGINVAIASAGSSSSSDSQSGSIGVGFAIPVNTVERVAAALIKDGKVTHGLLGATISDADTSSSVTGAVVRSVVSGGPAASAGIKSGDVITGVDSASIQNATDLTAYVRSLAPGTEVKVAYERDGSTGTAEVTLGTASS